MTTKMDIDFAPFPETPDEILDYGSSNVDPSTICGAPASPQSYSSLNTPRPDLGDGTILCGLFINRFNNIEKYVNHLASFDVCDSNRNTFRLYCPPKGVSKSD